MIDFAPSPTMRAPSATVIPFVLAVMRHVPTGILD
jgi:hypothetical protein